MDNMENKEKRINSVKNIIVNYFYQNDIYKSSCLAQSYLLYKYMLQLNYKPKLIKGYIINNVEQVYYGHFYIEHNNNIYDLSTDAYLLDYKLEHHNEIKNKMRILSKNIPSEIFKKYKNIDEPLFDMIRNKSYNMCMEDRFLEDVSKNAPIEIYEKIKYIYDKIIK